jgi:predicted nucleic acid-binding protein
LERLRIYADTSVLGGYFDDEFAEYSRKLFEEVKAGKFLLVVSEAMLDELQQAPDEVR